MAQGWKPVHYGLAGMMLVFGSFNTLSVKWADTMTSESVSGKQMSFNHPFLQATGEERSYKINKIAIDIDTLKIIRLRLHSHLTN